MTRDEALGLLMRNAPHDRPAAVADMIDAILAAYERGRVEEREACAKICDARARWMPANDHGVDWSRIEARDIAKDIRARGAK